MPTLPGHSCLHPRLQKEPPVKWLCKLCGRIAELDDDGFCDQERVLEDEMEGKPRNFETEEEQIARERAEEERRGSLTRDLGDEADEAYALWKDK